jgi:tRNA dimethylallyltransferase
MKRLLVIVGPTASGKTALAEALAAQHPLRLLSADSQQVYRGMDIGTAKPLGEAKAAWGLLDLVEPGQPFSAGEFCRAAVPAIATAWAAGKTPCLCGGTGLYLKALLEGLAEIPPVPEDVREALTAELHSHGLPALAARLSELDPVIAARTDLQNPRRVLRALEVLQATGRPLSQWQSESTAPAVIPDEALWLGVDPGKEALDERIQARTDQLLTNGWAQEVALLAQRFGEEAIRRSAAIGYPELLDLQRGQQNLAQAREAIVRQTQQYARRQRTWFKAVEAVEWLPATAAQARAHTFIQG